jgi:hypothetical protein
LESALAGSGKDFQRVLQKVLSARVSVAGDDVFGFGENIKQLEDGVGPLIQSGIGDVA